MKYYFQLQFKVICRKFRFAGVHPALGFALIIAAFTLISSAILQRYEYGAMALIYASAVLAIKLATKQRNEQLALIFENPEFKLLRFLENMILAIPFVVALVLNGSWLFGLGLILLMGLTSLFSWQSTFQTKIPTPFSSRPFEFARGFRITFPLLLLSIVLCGIAIWSGNANVGFIPILILFAGMLHNYSGLEPEVYVWNYAGSVGEFVWYKAKTFLIFGSLTLFPFVALLSIAYPSMGLYFFLSIPICWVYLLMMVLAKYSCFPTKMSFLHDVILSFGFIPFLTPFVIVFFWMRAERHLKTVLS